MTEYLTRTNRVEAYQWPREWKEQSRIAKHLGTKGIYLQFENGAEPVPTREYPGSDEPVETKYIPQLFLFTHRFDRVPVRIGDWIVLLGDHRFSVVPRDDFADYYKKAS